LKPALEGFLARQGQQVIVHGPVPADTAFYKGYHGEYDGVLAMYHDQGLAPLKTVHFDEAVNITGGLDIFRVSPDHGPARDLYLKRTASLVSFQTALQHCLRYFDH
jgi:4-hydroxythreonine-4-phosphate dehydrogenase